MKKTTGLLLFLFLGNIVIGQEIKKWKVTELQRYLKSSEAPVVVNFWATFCKPCMEEIPYFQRIAAKYEKQKVKLLFVSLDIRSFYPEQLQSFIKKNNISAEVIWLDETDADYFCPVIDPDWSGVIPATLFLNNSKGHRRFYQQQLKPEFFEARLKDAVGLQ